MTGSDACDLRPPIPVAIDCDPGIDDAIALCIALFSPQVDVRLITSVAGNVSQERTTHNALALESYLGTSVPVAAGAQGPLLRAPIDASGVHGTDGLAGWPFPEPRDRLLLADGAVEALRKTISSSNRPVTLICLGPLTNLALLLNIHPEVSQGIERVVSMAAGLKGVNVTSHAEFNVAADPEAAAIAFAACARLGIPLTLVPMEVGQQAFVPREAMRQACADTVTGKLVWYLYDRYRSVDAVAGRDGKEMYDPSAVGYVLEPSLYTARQATVKVRLSGSLVEGAGATTFDARRQPAWDAFPCEVVYGVDQPAFVRWFVQALRRCV